MCFYINTIWLWNVFLCQPGKTSTFFSVVVLVERQIGRVGNVIVFAQCHRLCLCMYEWQTKDICKQGVKMLQSFLFFFLQISAKSKFWAAGSNLFWDQLTAIYVQTAVSLILAIHLQSLAGLKIFHNLGWGGGAESQSFTLVSTLASGKAQDYYLPGYFSFLFPWTRNQLDGLASWRWLLAVTHLGATGAEFKRECKV